jgi:glycosyltransferase involved in cell wall biosynthesis
MPNREITRLKALFVLDRLQDGGAQIQALDLAAGLISAGIPCRAVALYAEASRSRHMGVETCGLGVSARAASFPLACLRLLNICRRERPDFVHSHAEAANLASRIVCRWLGLPHFVTAHSEFPWNWRRKPGVAIDRHSSFLTHRSFAVSASVGRMLREELHIPPDRIRVIPNWPPRHAESRDGAPMPARGFPTIVHVARLEKLKRQDILLEAFREVRRHFPEAVLWIAGDGPEAPSLRAIGGDGVLFLGHRLDVPQLLRAADLFVLSSDWEGMPLSVLEAMSEGVPVVSTDVAGISDLLRNGVSGRIVPRRNSAALAEAMIECLNNPEKARAMGATGKTACDGLRDRGVASYIASYREVLSGLGEGIGGQSPRDEFIS